MPQAAARVPEKLAQGIRVGWGQDFLLDLWYTLGITSTLDVVFMGLHVAQKTSPTDMSCCYDRVTNQNATIMNLPAYGLEIGKKSRLAVLDAGNPIEAMHLRTDRLLVLANGKVIARRERQDTQVALPGRLFWVNRRLTTP